MEKLGVLLCFYFVFILFCFYFLLIFDFSTTETQKPVPLPPPLTIGITCIEGTKYIMNTGPLYIDGKIATCEKNKYSYKAVFENEDFVKLR